MLVFTKCDLEEVDEEFAKEFIDNLNEKAKLDKKLKLYIQSTIKNPDYTC